MESQAIWHPQAPARVYLRKAFTLPAPVAAGRLECALHGWGFEVSLDGHVIGRGVGSGAGEAPAWCRLEMSQELAVGRHELTVLADGGSGNAALPAWFRCRGHIGADLEIVSDASWQAAAAQTEDRLPPDMLEVHDASGDPRFLSTDDEDAPWNEICTIDVDEARVIPEGKRATTETLAIRPSEIVSSDEVTLSERLSFSTEPGEMRASKCVHPDGLLGSDRGRTIVQTRSADHAVVIVVDFGRVLSGRPHLRLRTEARGGTIDLGFACGRSGVQTTARYVCRSGGQEWTGLRLQRGRFLILRLSRFAVDVELERAELIADRIAVSSTGTLSEPEDLRTIWQTGQRSVDLCRHERYEVGPIQEPFDWTRAFAVALNDYYLTGDCSAGRGTLQAQLQVQPQRDVDESTLGLALFANAYHRYSGDTVTIESVSAVLRRLLEDPQENSHTVAGLAWRAGCVQALVGLFLRLGDRDSATLGETLIASIKANLETAWSEKEGLYSDVRGGQAFGQWTNGLILYFGLTDPGRHEQMVSALRPDHVEAVTDYLQAFFVLGGLWRAGAETRALEFTRNRWGRIAGRDGSSWSDKVGVSQQHGLEVPGPEYYLGSHVLGVRPASPGWQIMEVRPPAQLAGGARGRLVTGRGHVDVEWHRHKTTGGLTLKVAAERAGETHFRLRRSGRFPSIELNGEPVWRNEKMIPNANTRLVMAEDDEITLVVHDAGPYEVRVE